MRKIINLIIDFLEMITYNVNIKMIININKLFIKKEDDLMPLALAPVGEEKTIIDFRGKDDVKRHLTDLGFIKGQTVQVLGSNTSGLILLVKGVRIALNRGLATKIMVA